MENSQNCVHLSTLDHPDIHFYAPNFEKLGPYLFGLVHLSICALPLLDVYETREWLGIEVLYWHEPEI